ncbi:hypothetical protein N7462_006736 [Penicillium macrosclerotiorum]|uniref:uncharacterized protein n=1 Tax=Penicillium macrosclerotiorum TaxID=303699 RepID=UPI0025493F8F|nr:uncharacterized protein N7462_006736 [Penicillium macrosclerotiorum]KAJ5683571.1 hypothetical protein N7462_006736 [Penicillium macrosclerotiorum]
MERPSLFVRSQLISTNPENLPVSAEDWSPSWQSHSESQTREDRQIFSTTGRGFIDQYDLRKKLLRLHLDIVEDLELLNMSVCTGTSSSVRGEATTSTVGKLDLPIFRMLGHSSNFLEILECSVDLIEGNRGVSFDVNHLETSAHGGDGTSGSPRAVGCDKAENKAGTAQSQESCFFTLMTPPRHNINVTNLPWDISTSLSMLSTYCDLIRVHRTIFNELYQILLTIPPVDATPFLLLSNLPLGQFQTDGSLTVQVQVLIQLSSTLFSKIDHILGIPLDQAQDFVAYSHPTTAISQNSELASIRDHVITNEDSLGRSALKESISYLRQIVEDFVTV